jgi:hypothetical protein
VLYTTRNACKIWGRHSEALAEEEEEEGNVT